tara:strand:+ start:2027 stop:3823 length:1797 start_codon:yes stop_codon:yes gene_type:complete
MEILKIIDYYNLMDIKLSDVIKNQSIINIGCTGHVANGKSTIVKSLTGITTQKFKSEKERNITINIGYAGCKIYYSKQTDEYRFTSSNTKDNILDSHGNVMVLVHHFSFVDCPGHESFMNNMITGTSVMDMAFLIEDCSSQIIPQPQTYEHLIALLNSNIKDILVLQNKCDLVDKEVIYIVKDKIDKFLNVLYKKHDLPIIPCIAQTGVNMNYIAKYLNHTIKSYSRDLNKPLLANIVRTFDINRSNIDYNKLKGGVIGGSILNGVIKIGDYIQISPGIVEKKNKKWVVNPIFTKITSLSCDSNQLKFAIPGGLIGFGTNLDPYLCKGNKLVGHVVSPPNESPPIVYEVTIHYNRFKRDIKYKLNKNDCIKVGVMGSLVDGVIKDKSDDGLVLSLEKPTCLSSNKLTIIHSKNYKILGIGTVINHKLVDIINNIENIEDIENKNKVKYNLINDLQYNNDYNYNFEKMVSHLEGCKVQKKKLNISKPVYNKIKRNQFSLINFKEIINSCINNNDTEDLEAIFIQEFEKEIKSKVSFNSQNHLLINEVVKKDIIDNSFIKLIIKMKRCRVCNSTQTYLSKSDRLLKINCETCKSQNSYQR